jgi:RNA polymerase sigma-70 factor (ECF subfamily)
MALSPDESRSPGQLARGSAFTTLEAPERDTNSRHARPSGASCELVEPSDVDLLRGLAAGDSQAFDCVYAQLRAPLHAFLVRLSGRAELAEDLLQETWLRLARSAPELPEGTPLRPWLFTVARNLFRSHRRWRLLDADRLRQLGWLPRAALPSPFEALAASTAQRALEHALSQLPVEQREVLLLCVSSGLEPAQVSTLLGITPEATRQRLARARARLRQSLELVEKARP